MTEDTSPENLRKFLASDDPAIRRMGLSMAKGSGSLDKAIIGLYFWDPEEENQKAADELIKEIGIEKFKEFPEWLEPFNHSKLEETFGWMLFNHLTTSVERISSFADGRSTDLLISVLKDDNHHLYDRIYGIAVEELGKRETTKAVPILIDILEKNALLGSEELSISCINALRRINDKRGIEPIKPLIVHGSQNIRKNAAESLETLGWKPETQDEKLDYLVAKQAWTSLILNGKDAVEKLVPRLEDKSETICCEAAKTLGKIGDESVVEPLIKALGMDTARTSSSSSYKYRNGLNVAALNALTEIGEPAIPNLIKNIRNRKMKISEGCIEMLGNIGDSRALNPLVEILELKKESKRKKAFEALENLSKNIEIPLNIKERMTKKIITWLDEAEWRFVDSRTYVFPDEFFKKIEIEENGLVVNLLDKSLEDKDMTSRKRKAIISILKKIGGERVVSVLIKNLHKKEAFRDIKYNIRYDDYDNAIPKVPTCTDKIFILVKGGKNSLYKAKYNGKNSKSWRGGDKKYYLSHPAGTPKRDLAFYSYKSPSKSTASTSPNIVNSVIEEKDLIFSLSEDELLKIMKKEDRIVFLEDVVLANEYRIDTYESANEPEKMPWNIEWPRIPEEAKNLIHADPVTNKNIADEDELSDVLGIVKVNELLTILDNHGKNENEELWSSAAANLGVDGVSKAEIKAKAILELGKLKSDKSVKVLLDILEKIRIVMLSWEKRRENIPVGKGSVAKKKVIEQQQQLLLENLENEYIGNNEATIRIIAKVLGEIGNKDAVEPLTNLYLETIATPGEWIWDDNNEYVGSAEKSMCSGFTQKYIRSALEKLDTSKLEFIDKEMMDKYQELGYNFSCKDQCVTEDLPEKRWGFGQYSVKAMPEKETTGPNTYYLQCDCGEYNSGFEERKGYCTHTDEVKDIINLICDCLGRLSGFQTSNFANIEYLDISKTWHKPHSGRVSIQNIYYLLDSYRTGYRMHESPSITGYFEFEDKDEHLLKYID